MSATSVRGQHQTTLRLTADDTGGRITLIDGPFEIGLPVTGPCLTAVAAAIGMVVGGEATTAEAPLQGGGRAAVLYVADDDVRFSLIGPGADRGQMSVDPVVLGRFGAACAAAAQELAS